MFVALIALIRGEECVAKMYTRADIVADIRATARSIVYLVPIPIIRNARGHGCPGKIRGCNYCTADYFVSLIRAQSRVKLYLPCARKGICRVTGMLINTDEELVAVPSLLLPSESAAVATHHGSESARAVGVR